MTGGWLNALLLEANKRRSTTAVDPQHLKVKDDTVSVQPKITASLSAFKKSAQFINLLFHRFILKMQQISGFHELKDHGHFSPGPTKNY